MTLRELCNEFHILTIGYIYFYQKQKLIPKLNKINYISISLFLYFYDSFGGNCTSDVNRTEIIVCNFFLDSSTS